MDSKTVFGKLVAKDDDCGYITYVFDLLKTDPEIGNYVMCVRYPNWEHPPIAIGEEGYLHFIEVIAGIDKYFDGNSMIPYRFSTWQFIKFIPKKDNVDKELVID